MPSVHVLVRLLKTIQINPGNPRGDHDKERNSACKRENHPIFYTLCETISPRTLFARPVPVLLRRLLKSKGFANSELLVKSKKKFSF
jgi:hypothetical protein